MYIKITVQHSERAKFYNIIYRTNAWMYGINYDNKIMKIESYYHLNQEPYNKEMICIDLLDILPIDYRKQMGYND